MLDSCNVLVEVEVLLQVEGPRLSKMAQEDRLDFLDRRIDDVAGEYEFDTIAGRQGKKLTHALKPGEGLQRVSLAAAHESELLAYLNGS